MSARNGFIFLSISISVFLLAMAAYSSAFYWGFLIAGPIILLGLYQMLQTRRTILRLYPVIGTFRYMFEAIRPEIQQYFVETNTN
ncbi:MAG: FMN-binding glutamate synthase family protein, partial [Gammaproteobacteria bacterium]|nr:FMN-binding glutamate synthase family protein [Gammaproteobacteria bacterium]